MEKERVRDQEDKKSRKYDENGFRREDHFDGLYRQNYKTFLFLLCPVANYVSLNAPTSTLYSVTNCGFG